MKIVADESVDGQVVSRLCASGHDVLYVAELAPGIDDEIILGQSRESGAVLITADKDFGELVFRQRKLHSGIVLLRLAGLSAEQNAETAAFVFTRHSGELSQRFTVVTQRSIRIRPLHE